MRLKDIEVAQKLPDTHLLVSASHLRTAAVILLLIERDGEDWVLFTRRSQFLRAHRGQISFPGGKKDPEDKSLKATALRETYEELGVPADKIQLLGTLDSFPTQTGFYVYPFVGRLAWPVTLVPEPAEIDEVFQVPLRHLQDLGYYSQQIKEVNGKNYPVHYFQYLNYTIWGITGHILKTFLDVL